MFDANGTEGLELFTWIVAALIGLVVALALTHALTVTKEEEDVAEGEEAEEEKELHKETTA